MSAENEMNNWEGRCSRLEQKNQEKKITSTNTVFRLLTYGWRMIIW